MGIFKVLLIPNNNANGETRPICGDIDGDGLAEIVVSFGTYIHDDAWIGLLDDSSMSYAYLIWKGPIGQNTPKIMAKHGSLWEIEYSMFTQKPHSPH